VIDTLAEDYLKAGKPVVFFEQDVDNPIDGTRKNRWWRSYLAFGGNPSGAMLPWVMTDSGSQVIFGETGPTFYNYSTAMIDASLARPPQAGITAQVQRVGNSFHFDVQVTNLSGVTLSPSNEATVYGIVYEEGATDGLTSRYVRAAASTGISSLASGATASFALDTSALSLSGVQWSHLHPVVLVDYRPGGSSGQYDMLQAAFEYSPAPFTVNKFAEPGTVNGGDPLTYTIQVNNTSDVNVDFTVTDNLPQQVTYVGPTVWSPPLTLRPGDIWETTFAVTVSDTYSGILFNQVSVTNTQGATATAYAVANADEKIYVPTVLKAAPAPSPADGWKVVLQDGFEGAFPGSWVITDGGDGYQWAKRSCNPYQGTHSAWAIGGGTVGAGLPCGTYTATTDITSEMTYGPFSLSDASQAELRFKYWNNTNVTDEYFSNIWFCAALSTNGVHWLEESCIYGNSGGWLDATFDLTKYDVVGADQVWVRLAFANRYPSLTLTEGGAYIDNVVVRKR